MAKAKDKKSKAKDKSKAREESSDVQTSPEPVESGKPEEDMGAETEKPDETPAEPPVEHKPMVAFSMNKAKDVRLAVPAADVTHTAMALKTCTRFVGGWIVLTKDTEVKARKEIIESLRRQGLVR